MTFSGLKWPPIGESKRSLWRSWSIHLSQIEKGVAFSKAHDLRPFVKISRVFFHHSPGCVVKWTFRNGTAMGCKCKFHMRQWRGGTWLETWHGSRHRRAAFQLKNMGNVVHWGPLINSLAFDSWRQHRCHKGSQRWDEKRKKHEKTKNAKENNYVSVISRPNKLLWGPKRQHTFFFNDAVRRFTWCFVFLLGFLGGNFLELRGELAPGEWRTPRGRWHSLIERLYWVWINKIHDVF